jgi:hypothetical protein
MFDDSEGSVLFLDDLKINYGFATSTTETPGRPVLSLFPNPATDEMTLLGYDPRRRYGYQLSGTDGKMLRTGTLTGASVSLDFLEAGLYILTLTDDEGLTSNLKFVKQ